jgi:hypothetical protein
VRRSLIRKSCPAVMWLKWSCSKGRFFQKLRGLNTQQVWGNGGATGCERLQEQDQEFRE